MVRERVTLYGLTLAADREVLLGRLGDLVIERGRGHLALSRSARGVAGGTGGRLGVGVKGSPVVGVV